MTVLSTGALPSEEGQDWKALKLFIGNPANPTELFLNVGVEADRGVFREKDVVFRAPLVAHLAAAFGDVSGLPPIELPRRPNTERRHRPPRPPSPPATRFSIASARAP